MVGMPEGITRSAQKLKEVIEKLKVNNNCFVIAPIGNPDSETRRRSDQILKYVITPAAKICGYETIRADQISEQGIITNQVIQQIIEDQMVIADLTDRNPNVFYELAIRHAIGRPYVQIIQKDERIPFDVAGVRTLEVDYRDLDSVETAKVKLVESMQSMQGQVQIESPISAAVGLTMLRNITEFLDEIRELKLVGKEIADKI